MPEQMTKGSIAAVGDENSIMPFKAVGAATYKVDSLQGVESVLNEVIAKDYAVIFVTEDLQEQAQIILEQNPEQTYLYIPPIRGAQGHASKALDELIKKTIGTNY